MSFRDQERFRSVVIQAEADYREWAEQLRARAFEARRNKDVTLAQELEIKSSRYEDRAVECAEALGIT